MTVAEEVDEEQEEEEVVELKETFLRTVTEQVEPPVTMRQMSDESAQDVLVEMRSQSSDESSMVVIGGRPSGGEGKAEGQENEDSNMRLSKEEVEVEKEKEAVLKKGTYDGGDSSDRIGQSTGGGIDL